MRTKKKYFLILLVVLSINSLFAQIATEIEYTFQDSNNFKCKSILYIVNKESIYKIFDNRENGIQEKQSENGDYIAVQNDEISKIFYTNDTIEITRIPLYKSEIIYKNNNGKLNIDFTKNKKIIGSYNCQEVKAVINGRKYSIWFTSDVELNFGPYRLNWVPGLIVEIYEETNKIKLTLNSIKKSSNTTDFNKFKEYIFSKKILLYEEYESKIISIMTTKKASSLAKIKEMGGELEYKEDQSAFTQFLVDIPTNLVSELQKIN